MVFKSHPREGSVLVFFMNLGSDIHLKPLPVNELQGHHRATETHTPTSMNGWSDASI